MVDVSNVKGLSFSGHTLNVAERALLSAAIMKKGIEENLAVSFWGKIFGTEANYLVCVGIVQKFSGVPSKKFFYLVSGGENPSSELAELEAARHPELAAKDEGKPFTGAPDTELREAEEEGQDAYTEAHRLAFAVAVRSITHAMYLLVVWTFASRAWRRRSCCTSFASLSQDSLPLLMDWCASF